MAIDFESFMLPLMILLLLGASAFLFSIRESTGFNRTQSLINGTLFFTGIGLLSSAWTYAIHNSLVADGNSEFCASEGLIQCGSVIGDPTWNNLFGIPWGVLGVASFSLIFFLTLSMKLDPHAKWVPDFAKFTRYATLLGIPFVVMLVVIELTLVDGAPHICPYCTVAHLSLIGCLICAHLLYSHQQSGNWAKGAN